MGAQSPEQIYLCKTMVMLNYIIIIEIVKIIDRYVPKTCTVFLIVLVGCMGFVMKVSSSVSIKSKGLVFNVGFTMSVTF